jgi:hypothetical protein
MIFSDLSSPAEAGFAKAENWIPFFGIMRLRLWHQLEHLFAVHLARVGQQRLNRFDEG